MPAANARPKLTRPACRIDSATTLASERQHGGRTPGVARACRRLLVVAAQHRERRDAAHGEQRQQREDGGHPDTDADAAADRRPRRGPGHVHGQHAAQQARQQLLQRGAQQRAERRCRSGPPPRPAAGRPRARVAAGVPRQRRTAIEGSRRLMKTCTALATPRPPSSSATSATRPRKSPKRPSVSESRRWSSATVRTLARSLDSRGRKRSAIRCTAAALDARRQAEVRLVAPARAEAEQLRLRDPWRAPRRRAARSRCAGRRRPACCRPWRGCGSAPRRSRARRRPRRRGSAAAPASTIAPPVSARRGHSPAGRVSIVAVERVAGVDTQHLHQARRRAAGHEGHGAEAHHPRHVGGRASWRCAARRSAPRPAGRRARPRRPAGRRPAASVPRAAPSRAGCR